MFTHPRRLESQRAATMRQSRRRAHHPEFHQCRHGCYTSSSTDAVGMALAGFKESEASGVFYLPAWWIVSSNTSINLTRGSLCSPTFASSVCAVSIVRATYVSQVSLTDGSCMYNRGARPRNYLMHEKGQIAMVRFGPWSRHALLSSALVFLHFDP